MKLEIDREELALIVQMLEEAPRRYVPTGAHPYDSLYFKVNELAKREFSVNYLQLELDLGVGNGSSNVLQ